MSDKRFGAQENAARYSRAMQGIAEFAKEYPEKAAILAQHPDLIKALVVGGTADPKRNIVDRKDLDLIFDLSHVENAARKKGLVNAYDLRDYVNALEYLQGHINSLRVPASGLYDMQAMIDRPLPGPAVDISKDVRQTLLQKPKAVGKAGIAATLAGGAGAASAGDLRRAVGAVAESFLPLGLTPSALAPGTLTPEQRAAADAATRRKRQQEEAAKMKAQALLRTGVPMPDDYRQGGRVRMI
jgi:hypothetical protein